MKKRKTKTKIYLRRKSFTILSMDKYSILDSEQTCNNQPTHTHNSQDSRKKKAQELNQTNERMSEQIQQLRYPAEKRGTV